MTRVLDRFLLAMLIVDGVVVGLGSVAFCYLRFWDSQFRSSPSSPAW